MPSEQHRTIKPPVVIVGAGPTGLSMAVQLLRYNIEFVILEKNESTTSLSKAIVVQARTLEIFQELGIADDAIKKGQITTALNVFYKGRRRAAVNLTGLGEGLSPFAFALSLEQSKTERLLADYLSTNKKTIQWKSEFTHFKQNENSVTVYYKDATAKVQKIEAAYLIGCDGASSLVRHQMNLPFEGDTVPKLFYVADVLLESPVVNKNELFMFLIKKGFILFFPMDGEGHYRVVGIVPDAKDADAPFQFEDIEESIKQQIVSPVEFKKLQWFSTYKVHSRKAGSFEKGRCFIAGDAAHIHTPAGGQGMNTGIQDAYNLAWKLAYAIRGEVNDEVVKTYNTERTENAKHLLQTTDRMFDMMAGTTGFWDFIRLYFIPSIASLITKSKTIKKRIFPLVSQTGISYSHNYLTVDSSIGKVKAGVRMPYFVFSDGRQIFDYLAEPAFKVLFFGNKEGNINQQLGDIKVKVFAYSFKDVPASLFKAETNFYILLRPDNHISYIGKDISKCRELLAKLSPL